MERYPVFGLEGLDGTGKSTVGKMLAEETGSHYIYFTHNSRLALLRKHFDNAPTPIRFICYLGVAIENYRYVEEERRMNNIFLDRTIFSTLAYHKSYGLPKIYTTLVPRFLYDQFDKIVFFQASDDERRLRLESRNAASKIVSQKSDDRSILFANSIDTEYQKVLPTGTIFVNTDSKTPKQVMNEVKNQIQIKRLI